MGHTHRYKFGFKKKNQVKSPSPESRTPNSVQIHQSGRTGIRGVTFSANENERFYQCWERYMEALNACPHHGFDTWLLVSYFYDRISLGVKQLLETMCGGDFLRKNLEEALTS